VCNNPSYTEREMTHQLRDAEPSVVIVADLMYAEYAPVFAALGIEHVVVTRLNDYMPFIKKLLAPALKFKKVQRAAGKPWPPVPKDAKVLRWHTALASAGPCRSRRQPRRCRGADLHGGTTGIARGDVASQPVANARQGAAWFLTVVEGEEALLAAMLFFHSTGRSREPDDADRGQADPVPNPRDMILSSRRREAVAVPGAASVYRRQRAPDALKFDLKSIKACVSGPRPCRRRSRRSSNG
jgi:long-chain acyl-CoA synthetase